jgi:hypothetical protein
VGDEWSFSESPGVVHAMLDGRGAMVSNFIYIDAPFFDPVVLVKTNEYIIFSIS